MADFQAAAEAVFREEYGRIIASLIRISGSFDRAEEALQDAFAAALSAWPEKGIPNNPGAWIMSAAHRRLIDGIRRDRTRSGKQDALRYESPGATPPSSIDEDGMGFPDDRLRLIFTCCHPALNRESQVALTLRTLGGLTTTEIARAFLIPEPTMAQRLVRAKRKIQEAGIPYEVPNRIRLPERLTSVQAVVYLIFNEGYTASHGDQLIRADLCAEAVRLARVLCELMPDERENRGLLALMLIHGSRRDARVREGKLITLQEQDRTLWHTGEIQEGLRLIEPPLSGPYQVQAAIAGVHAQARTSEQTDWKQIAALYRELLSWNDSPVIALNHAAAVAMSEGLETGLEMLDALGASGHLDNYYLFHAARADVLRRLNRYPEAAMSYRRALHLATNPVEREFLTARIELCEVNPLAR